MKRIHRIIASVCALAICATMAGCGDDKEKDKEGGTGSSNTVQAVPSDYTMVFPEKISGNLHNPGMGWITLEETSWAGKPDLGVSGQMDEVDVIGIQDAWGTIEREEGVFDWSRIDETIDYWVARGKRINLRICTDSQTLPETHSGSPVWLRDDYGVDYEWGVDKDCLLADLTDPVYQYFFDRFMRELADKYANNPYIDTVDIRGYGKWGEWHSGHDFADMSERITTLAKIVDVYARAFTASGKVLFLSATWEFDETMNPNAVAKTYEDYYKWQALDYATTTWDYVSIRRDGGAGNIIRYTQDAQFLSEFFRSGKNLPVCGEFMDGVDPALNRNYGMDTVESIDDILFTMHPNYCTVLGHINSEVARLVEIEGNRLYDRGNEKLGYRFAVDNARFPTTVQKGKEFTVETALSNSALGRFWMEGYDYAMLLLDGTGKEVCRGLAENFAPHTILNGTPVNFYTELTPDVPVGEYTLACAIVDAEGKPAIRMAMGTAEEYESKIYALGKIKVADAVDEPEKTYAETDAAGLKSYPFKKGNSYAVTFDYLPDFALKDFRYGSDAGFTITLNEDTPRELLRFWDVSGLIGRKTIVFTALTDAAGLSVGSDRFGSISVVGKVQIASLGGYHESFDGYDFTDMNAVYYPPVYDDVAIVTEGAVAGDSVELTGTLSRFNDLLQVDPNVYTLEKGSSYQISFDAKTTHPGGNACYFYLMLVDGDDRISIGEWLNRDDEGVQRYTYSFTVPETGDYVLTFGVKNQGSYLLDNILLTQYSGATSRAGANHASTLNKRLDLTGKGLGIVEGFEENAMNGSLMTYGFNRWGSYTHDPAKVIEGNTSVSSRIEKFYTTYLDEVQEPLEWFEFLYSNPRVVTFEPGKTYKIEFDYKVVEPLRNPVTGVNGYAYCLLRGSAGDRGNIDFARTSELGKTFELNETYHLEVTVTVGASNDYYFIVGTRQAGEIIIDNFKISLVEDEQTD